MAVFKYSQFVTRSRWLMLALISGTLGNGAIGQTVDRSTLDPAALGIPAGGDGSIPDLWDLRRKSPPTEFQFNSGELAALDATNVDDFSKLTQKTVSSYPDTSQGRAQLLTDLNLLKTEGQRLGLYPKDQDFDRFWAENAAKFTASSNTALVKGIPMNQLASAVFGATTIDIGKAIDRADPKQAELLEKQGKPTPGQQRMQADIDRHESWNAKAIAAGVLVGAGGIWKGVKWFASFSSEKVLGATLFNISNDMVGITFSGPMDPIKDKYRTWYSSRVQTHRWMIGFKRWINGETRDEKEGLQQEKALDELLQKIANGEDVDPKKLDELRRGKFFNPSLSIKDAVRYNRVKAQEFYAANAAHQGIRTPSEGAALGTGMEIVYQQARWWGEQLNLSLAARSAALTHKALLWTRLTEAGVTSEDISRYYELKDLEKDTWTFGNPYDGNLKTLNKEMSTLTKRMLNHASPALMDELCDNAIGLADVNNREALALASILEMEQAYPEHNKAIGRLSGLQAWQEQSREMTGFYDALRRQKTRIERFFAQKGIRWDVRARYEQRHFPLGGSMRPSNKVAWRDVSRDEIDRAKGINPDAHVIDSNPAALKPLLGETDLVHDAIAANAKMAGVPSDLAGSSTSKKCSNLWGKLKGVVLRR